jgi:hypothetical protein
MADSNVLSAQKVAISRAKAFNKLGGIEESWQVFGLKANQQNL